MSNIGKDHAVGGTPGEGARPEREIKGEPQSSNDRPLPSGDSPKRQGDKLENAVDQAAEIDKDEP